jgi:hypothetical protein
MALSARDRRILSEIERDFIAVEPRLAHALGRGKSQRLRRNLILASGEIKRGRYGWTAGLLFLLLSGIALLVVGLVLHTAVLICVGVPLTQFGPVLAVCIYRRAHGRSLRGRPASGALG